MKVRLSPIHALLCQTIADGDESTRYNAAQQLRHLLGDEQLLAFAATNDVSSLFAHLLSKNESPSVEPWINLHAQKNARLSSYMAELDRIGALLARENIPLVALKNAGIARGLYPCPGCCPMGDVDVLIEKRHFRAAHRILVDDGYQFEFRSPLEEASLDAAEQGGGTEYWKLLPNGQKLWLELQWRPVAGRWIRPDQEPSAEELLARSVPIPGSVVRMLSPEDNLLQVALHTAKHSYVRAPGFRLHTDVDRIVRRQSIQWSTFLQRVRALQVKTAVYFSLAIPQKLFQTPIPEEVLASLRPSLWKEQLVGEWLQKVGLFNPHERKFSRVSYVFFTALLYDDFGGLRKGMFPTARWMRERYQFQSFILLPYYHGRRIFDLAFRRVST